MRTYTTLQGDRWDAIAWRVYGSERYMEQLVQANPEHIETLLFRAGVTLVLPEIPPEAAQDVPIWRRADA